MGMEDSVTDLQLAVKANDVERIRKLLGGGGSVLCCDSFGRSLLHFATAWGQEEALKALLLNTSKQMVDVRDKCGRTPLHYACSGGRADFAGILIKRGANVNCRDSNGRTPLHYAAQNVGVDVVEILVKNGADKNVRDCSGGRPWDVAQKWGSPDVLEVLSTKDEDLGGVREIENGYPFGDKREQDIGLGIMEGGNSPAVKSCSLDVLLGEWKRAEEQKKKQKKMEAVDGLEEALKAWREAEAKAKMEKESRLDHPYRQDLKNQVSSSSYSFYSTPRTAENENSSFHDKGSRMYWFSPHPDGNSASPCIRNYFASERNAEDKVDDVWGCTEWESPLRIDEMKGTANGMEKWERVMDWKPLSKLTSETWKEPWFRRRNQAPASPIAAI